MGLDDGLFEEGHRDGQRRGHVAADAVAGDGEPGAVESFGITVAGDSSGDLRRDTGLGAPRRVIAPALWQVQFPIDQRTSLAAGVGEEDTQLAVLSAGDQTNGATTRGVVAPGNRTLFRIMLRLN